MKTVNGWYAGGKGGDSGNGGWVSVQSMREMWEDFCSNFLEPFLENIDRRSCNDGSRELFPMLPNPYRKGRSTLFAVARTLYGCPLRPRRVGESKNKFGSASKRPVNILNADCRKSLPLHSLLVGEVTNANYQPCNKSLKLVRNG